MILFAKLFTRRKLLESAVASVDLQHYDNDCVVKYAQNVDDKL